jgi:hypothetical protein
MSGQQEVIYLVKKLYSPMIQRLVVIKVAHLEEAIQYAEAQAQEIGWSEE